MKFLWCDTETTGLKPENSAPFEVAFIFVCSQTINNQLVKDETSRLYYLNPLDIPGIEYSEETGKVHGYTREAIEQFDPSDIAIKKMNDFLNYCFKFRTEEKMFFCGYNGKFDFEHLVSLFNHRGYNFQKYFNTNLLDVYEQVKRAGAKKVLPYLENRKLTTVAKFLHIDLDNAHDAMGDITATREVAKSLSTKGIPLQ